MIEFAVIGLAFIVCATVYNLAELILDKKED